MFSKYEPPAPQEPLPVYIQIRLLRFFEKAFNGVHIQIRDAETRQRGLVIIQALCRLEHAEQLFA